MPDGYDGLRGKKTERDVPFTPRLARYRSPEAPRSPPFNEQVRTKMATKDERQELRSPILGLFSKTFISCGVANS